MSGLFASAVDHQFGQACALHDAGQSRQAETILHAILETNPAHLPARARLAEIAIERHDHAVAIAQSKAILAIEPKFAPALSHLAHGLWLAGRLEDALIPARAAVEIQPTNPWYRITLGHILAVMGQPDAAEQAIQPVLDQGWHDRVIRARALTIAAEARNDKGDFKSAHAALEEAIRLSPDHEPLWMAYGISLLRQGRFAEGWAAYRRRTQIRFFSPDNDGPLPGTRWTGQDLTGKTILLKDEQGYGDAIQFFRYIPLLRQAGARRITLLTYPGLHDLFRASTGLADVVSEPDPHFQADFHCLTGDLPGALGTNLTNIPSAVPYVRPPLRESQAQGGVGLVWSGDPRHLRDHARSIPADMFLRIADTPGHRFISLQHNIRPQDLPALAARPAIVRRTDNQTDFGHTASMIASLDLVITVDTSVAHLAGALGKPVWVLIPRVPDWRWMLGRQDSPWYPTMRLFRADSRGWPPVIGKVTQALARFRPQPSHTLANRGARSHSRGRKARIVTS